MTMNLSREEIALRAMLALIPVYWDTVDEYENADELVKSNIETAFEYADEFLKRKEMTSLKQKIAKYGERKTSERFPSWIVDESYKIVDAVEELRSKCFNNIPEEMRAAEEVVRFRVKLEMLRQVAGCTADQALHAEAKENSKAGG